MLPVPPLPVAAAAAPAAARADAGAPRPTTRVDAIDAVLPQTQCTRCGHDGCRPYAEAIAGGDAINRCPPGGAATIAALARLTGRAIVALDPAHGEEAPLTVARIDEAWCIGCTLCIDACPVDAIAGGPKRMHTVLSALCTGCALCLPPCPVDCIAMIAAGRAWSESDAAAARSRFDARNRRHANGADVEAEDGHATGGSAGADDAGNSGVQAMQVAVENRGAMPSAAADGRSTEGEAKQERQAAVAAALQRARARRGAASGKTH